MSLTKYHAKRRFEETPEPEGKAARGRKNRALVFVVQKHQASRLHYDFRLELEGVLKSWAVPKGPSLNPSDKRLAMMVEDHPFDYRTFEGTIPAGNYGAGTVMVWDAGAYHASESDDAQESEKILLQGLRRGHLQFVLEGKKLRGEFSLIKMHGKEENAWLLVKKQDEFATKADVTAQDRSVTSKRDLEEIAENKKGKNQFHESDDSDAPARKSKSHAR